MKTNGKALNVFSITYLRGIERTIKRVAQTRKMAIFTYMGRAVF
jgi:hypothetical protein